MSNPSGRPHRPKIPEHQARPQRARRPDPHPRHAGGAAGLLPDAVVRVDWSTARIASARNEALRSLATHASKYSAWHRERLAGVDLGSLDDAQLRGLPTMTKDDLMDHFDSIVTDPRVDVARCEARLAAGERTVDGGLALLVTGGTRGRAAFNVLGSDELSRVQAAFLRMVVRWGSQTGTFTKRAPRRASITAGRNGYGVSALMDLFGSEGEARLAVTDPIQDIVAALDATDPEVLIVFPSKLPELASWALADRFVIRPRLIVAVGEPYLAEHRAAVDAAWGCPVLSCWAATETGVLGCGSGFENGMLLFDDHAIIEPVDAEGRPVLPGQRSAKVFVTPLYQTTVPLLRYELEDQICLVDRSPRCGSGFRLAANVDGRSDEEFTYPGGLSVRPHVFRAILGQQRGILEYQVVQTFDGAVILAICPYPLETGDLCRRLSARLAQLGLAGARVTFERVAGIPREGGGLTLRRFVPLDDREAA